MINCEPNEEMIREALAVALSPAFRERIENSINPYGDGNVSEKIMKVIKRVLMSEISLKKTFYDME